VIMRSVCNNEEWRMKCRSRSFFFCKELLFIYLFIYYLLSWYFIPYMICFRNMHVTVTHAKWLFFLFNNHARGVRKQRKKNKKKEKDKKTLASKYFTP
ncbi:hypothetical protein T310_8710, partial [Rasamsonia emersonii CBS 393.64]